MEVTRGTRRANAVVAAQQGAAGSSGSAPNPSSSGTALTTGQQQGRWADQLVTPVTGPDSIENVMLSIQAKAQQATENRAPNKQPHGKSGPGTATALPAGWKDMRKAPPPAFNPGWDAMQDENQAVRAGNPRGRGRGRGTDAAPKRAGFKAPSRISQNTGYAPDEGDEQWQCAGIGCPKWAFASRKANH